MGGEPDSDEVTHSKYLAGLGYSPSDIENLLLLRRIPFHPELKDSISDAFKLWYRQRTNRDFEFSRISKDEVAVNCTSSDSWTQRLACNINLNRDRHVIETIDRMSRRYKKLMVVYGAGHFVQELDAFKSGCSILGYTQ